MRCESAPLYATMDDVAERSGRHYTPEETNRGYALLEDAAAMIDAYRAVADPAAKRVVSCRMVLRVMGEDDGYSVPMGANQGSIAAGGYSQSWTITGGGSGELYLSKADKLLLGGSNRIGSGGPLTGLVRP